MATIQEKPLTSQQKYYYANKDKVREWKRNWNERNIDKRRLQYIRHYYRTKKGLEGGELEMAIENYKERYAERHAKKDSEN